MTSLPPQASCDNNHTGHQPFPQFVPGSQPHSSWHRASSSSRVLSACQASASASVLRADRKQARANRGKTHVRERQDVTLLPTFTDLCKGILVQLSYTHTHMTTHASMRTRIHACTHMHRHACMQMHVHTHAHTHTFALTRVHAHAHAHLHPHVHTDTHTHVHILAHTCTHTHMYTQTHTHTDTHLHVHTHVHKCTYTCTHTHTDTRAAAAVTRCFLSSASLSRASLNGAAPGTPGSLRGFLRPRFFASLRTLR